jgi:hypothetical protein
VFLEVERKAGPFFRKARENASGKAGEAVSRSVELLLPLVPHPNALGVVGIEGDDGRDVSFAERALLSAVITALTVLYTVVPSRI